MKRFWRGLLAGGIATVPMSLVMQMLHCWPVREREPLPPQQITQALAEETAARLGRGERPGKSQLQVLALANHFGFGSGMGGFYALFGPRIPAPAVLKGTIWGLMVWGLSFLGWLPAAQILPPATQQSKRRNLLLIAGHLVWGVSTVLVLERLAPEEAA